MPGTRRALQFGPDTCTVSATVLGGQLVEADPVNIGLVRPAGANSVTVIGVARTDAQPAGSNPTSPLNTAWARPDTAVDYGPADVDVLYAASAKFGDLLVAAANGQVGPAGVAAAAINTTLAAASIVGATTISTAASIPTGTSITIDTGAGAETRTVTGVTGAGPYTLTVAALANAHASGVAVTAAATAGAQEGSTVGRCTIRGGVNAGVVGRMRILV